MRTSFAWLLVAGMALGACGEGGTPDQTRAEGTEYKFVANRLIVPTSATEYAIDLNGDGRPDNALGGILGALSTFFGNIQPAVDTAFQGGQAIILFGVQSTDPNLRAAANPGTRVYLGQPTAPTAPDFSGSGTFTVDTSISPVQFYGRLQNGRFTSNNPATTRNPVTVRINLPILQGVTLDVTLNGAYIQFNSSTTGLASGQINGSVKVSDIQQNVFPLVVQLLNNTIQADPNSTASQQIRTLFDVGNCTGGTAGNGVIEACEVQNNAIIQTALAPDVQIFAANGTTYDPCERPRAECAPDSISLGVGFTAVRANFNTPAQ